jgi:hypothetical protein
MKTNTGGGITNEIIAREVDGQELRDGKVLSASKTVDFLQ